MKNLRNKITTLLCVLLLSSATFAQQYPAELQNWSIGARLATYISHTDATGGVGISTEGFLERKLSDKIALQGTMLFGSISGGSGDELTLVAPGTEKKVSYAFNSRVFEMITHGKFYIQRDAFSPFASLGGGMIFYETQIDIRGNDVFEKSTGWNSVPTEVNKESGVYRDGVPIGSWIIPIGLGFNYSINEWFDISVSYTFRLTGTDNIDAITANSGGAENIAGVSTSGSANNFGQAAYNDNYTITQFREAAKARQEKAGTGDDMFSLLSVGIAYNFFDPCSSGEKKDTPLKEDE